MVVTTHRMTTEECYSVQTVNALSDASTLNREARVALGKQVIEQVHEVLKEQNPSLIAKDGWQSSVGHMLVISFGPIAEISDRHMERIKVAL